MSAEYKHKRYYRVRGSDSTLKTFSSTSNANTIIGFRDVYDTSSPTKTYALADSDKTLVVTHEFNTEDEQTAFKAAVDTLMDDSSTPWNPDADVDGQGGWVEFFKTEWLHKDGSVSDTTNLQND